MADKLFQCPECKMHYTDADLAKKCKQWCGEYGTCNIEIIQQSVEHQRLGGWNPN